MDAHAKLDRALATLTAPERARVLRELLAGLEACSPGAGSAAFDRARRGLPPRRLIAPAPAAVLSRVSKDILRQVAQLHHQAGAGVRQLQQGGTTASATALPAALAPAPSPAPAVRPTSHRRFLRVLFFAALLCSPAWLVIAQAGVWRTRSNLATTADRRRELTDQIATLRADTGQLEQRLQEIQPQADAAQQAETQRADLARQLEMLRQQSDAQTAERKRLEGLAEELNKVQAQRTAQQAAGATLDRQHTELQAKLDALRRRFPQLTFIGTRAGQERDDNGLRMKFCWCPPGTFTMGSPPSEAQLDSNENQVSVTLTRGFWLGKYEVTQGEWQTVMGRNPSYFSSAGGNCPVETVSWAEASEFCRKLTEQEHQAGRLPADWEYRLPTEAQWEYACRAGSKTTYSFGDSEAELDKYAWYSANSGSKTHPVGEKQANAWGLCDMHGNVWEWCRDWYSATLPGGTDPEVTSQASIRVLRGGGWGSLGRVCRSAYRVRYDPEGRSRNFGFRLAGVRSGS